MKILNPGMIQVRAVEDVEADQIIYQFAITFQTLVTVDLNLVDCDPAKAAAIAKDTGVRLLENEIRRHISAE